MLNSDSLYMKVATAIFGSLIIIGGAAVIIDRAKIYGQTAKETTNEVSSIFKGKKKRG